MSNYPILCQIDNHADAIYTENNANAMMHMILQHLDNITDAMGMTKGENVMSNMLLIEYVRHWMETVEKPNVKESTHDRLITQARTLEKYAIADMQIKNITCEDIMEYVSELVDYGYGWTTIKKQAWIVTAPLRHAAAMHILPVDPTIGVKMPSEDKVKTPRRDTRDFSPDEQDMLWKEIEKYESFCDHVIGFLLETGMRIHEALALTWDDVHFDRKYVHIHRTVIRLANQKMTKVSDSPKTFASKRRVPLRPRALDILARLEATAPNEWVFSNEEGTRLTYDSVRSRLKTLCKRAGVEYQPTHAARHTFTTNCFHSGIDIKFTSQLLGHYSTEVTQRVYTHLRGDGVDDLYNAIMQIQQ